MHLSPQSQAILLLTVSFGKNDHKSTKPLSAVEWAEFTVWLKDRKLEPSNLLNGNAHTHFSGFKDMPVNPDRIEYLLQRGAALALALEKWQRSGLWVITRSDQYYPEKLKQHLKLKSPAFLFGCGEKRLLNSRGLAIIGSREASKDDLNFTSSLGKKAAVEGYSVVSGCARGVDQSAMSGALDNKGTAIGVMADSLLKAATSKKYREKIMSGKLVLITPFNPGAGFNIRKAMDRNKYIYCLAHAAVVISSTVNKGGTWKGATEHLEAKRKVPLWVKRPANVKASGNPDLVEVYRGAEWLPDGDFSIKKLIETDEPTELESSDNLQPVIKEAEAQTSINTQNTPATDTSSLKDEAVSPEHRMGYKATQKEDVFYVFFIFELQKLTAENALSSKDILSQLNRMNLKMAQIRVWLKHGVDAGEIIEIKKGKKKAVKYQCQLKSAKNLQLSLNLIKET